MGRLFIEDTVKLFAKPDCRLLVLVEELIDLFGKTDQVKREIFQVKNFILV